MAFNRLMLWSAGVFILFFFFFQDKFYTIYSLQCTIRVSNSLDPDQAKHKFRPDLDPNYLQNGIDILHRLDMTIAVDWSIKSQTPNKISR